MSLVQSNAGFLFNDPNRVLKIQELRPQQGLFSTIITYFNCIWLAQNEAFVYKLKWCKRRIGFEHEFLLCYVKEKEVAEGQRHRRESVILVERNVGDDPPGVGSDVPQVGSGGNGATTPTSHPHPLPTRVASDTQVQAPRAPISFGKTTRTSSTSSSSSSRLSKRASGDAIYFSNTGDDEFAKTLQGEYDIAKELEIPEDTFSLLQLLTLVNTVHALEPNYSFETFNCYWFARAVYQTLHVIVPSSNDNTIFTPGTFQLIVRPFSDPHEKEEYKEKFLAAWESTKAEINAARVLRDKPLEDERENTRQERNIRLQLEQENQRLREQLAASLNTQTSTPAMA